MLETVSQIEAWKENVLELARDHRAKCDPSCGVSLYSLRMMAEQAGVTFTEEEKHLFV